MADLTVLLPVLNGEATIERAIVSTLRAADSDTTLLVLNDGSTDGTAAIVQSMAKCDRRIRVLTSEAPSGLAAGLNVLLAEARTSLVARMDADDVCLPWRFAHQLKALDRCRADVVFAPGLKRGPASHRYRPQLPFAAGAEAVAMELVLSNTLMHPTLVGDRRALLDVGGYRNVPAEDWDLWMRMALQGVQLARVGTFCLIYSLHAQQVTERPSWRAWLAGDEVMPAVHEALATRVLGDPFHGSFGSLVGAGGVEQGLSLVHEVWSAAARLPWADRLAVRANALAVGRRLRLFGSVNRPCAE